MKVTNTQNIQNIPGKCGDEMIFFLFNKSKMHVILMAGLKDNIACLKYLIAHVQEDKYLTSKTFSKKAF